VQTAEEVETAYKIARHYGRHILVEEQVQGKDYRVLVVGDRVVAVAHRMPAHVVGDGKLSIEQLIKEANSDPRRGTGHLKPMTKLKIDKNAEEVLRKQGLTPQSVPAEAQIVYLRENSNLSTGGSAVDVTDMIHPDNTQIALRAARKIGLDVAGIDIVAHDIAVPLPDQKGAIIEVNAAPGIRMHQHPAHGEAHDAGMAIVDNLFPPGAPVRVPIVAITGTNGKTTTTLLVSHILRHSGLNVGTATTEGIFINRRKIQAGDCTGYWSARTILSEPQVEFAVLETARGGLFKRGLAFSECDFAAVLNVGDDHLGQHGAETIEDLARVKSLVIQQVKAGGYAVLNADNEPAARMARLENLKARVIFFSLNEKNPTLIEHLHRGGQAVYLREKDRMIMVAIGEHRLPLINVEKVPMTYGGKSRHQVANAMAGVALLINSGLSSEQITAGLQTFTPTIEHNPGRMNLVRMRDFQVLIDYAHNLESYQAVLDMAKHLEHRRLIASVTMPGDRYDEKIREVGRLIGDHFDHVVVREMIDKRGRPPGELAAVLKEGVLQGRHVRPEQVEVIEDDLQGIKAVLDLGQPGDLVIIGCVDTDDSINLIVRELERQGQGGRDQGTGFRDQGQASVR
ncbi:MAG: hypothetical protein JOY51_05500, partial [Nevskia sp.]|nr:hypothetical protein [Nevskia sp.]